MSQNKKILKYLQSGKSLTPLAALSYFGCMRLSARIKNLRDQGYNISDEWYDIPRSNKRVKIYKIIKE